MAIGVCFLTATSTLSTKNERKARRKRTQMSARIAGFGHLGIYVRDLALMTEFWRDFMGMQVTKQSDGAVFFSSDPERSDPEIVIMKGRPSAEDPHLINQISMRV